MLDSTPIVGLETDPLRQEGQGGPRTASLHGQALGRMQSHTPVLHLMRPGQVENWHLKQKFCSIPEQEALTVETLKEAQ